jgi:hypothetical protein
MDEVPYLTVCTWLISYSAATRVRGGPKRRYTLGPSAVLFEVSGRLVRRCVGPIDAANVDPSAARVPCASPKFVNS